MFHFMLGFGVALIVVLILAWCCDVEKKERIIPESPINPDELAQTILRNLAAVQMLQLHLNVGSIDYRLAKAMIAWQNEHSKILIAVPVQEVEDADNKAMEDQGWERLKVALNSAWTNEDGMNEDYVN